MAAVTKLPENPSALVEQVIVKGDLGKLTPDERTRYYMEVCKSVGLNPLTKPFEYIVLNGRLVLYALRGATDQLRNVNGVSVEELTSVERDGVMVTTCKVRDRQGRSDIATGAVNIAKLTGETLANAIMKCETKAKRRATLSICGLSMLDETEVDTVPPERRAPPPAAQPEPTKVEAPKPEAKVEDASAEDTPHLIVLEEEEGKRNWIKWGGALIAYLKASATLDELNAWEAQNRATIGTCKTTAEKVFRSVDGCFAKRTAELTLKSHADDVKAKDPGDIPPFLKRTPDVDAVWATKAEAEINSTMTAKALTAWEDFNMPLIVALGKTHPEAHAHLTETMMRRYQAISDAQHDEEAPL